MVTGKAWQAVWGNLAIGLPLAGRDSLDLPPSCHHLDWTVAVLPNGLLSFGLHDRRAQHEPGVRQRLASGHLFGKFEAVFLGIFE
jgi:hypothetical protein